MANENENSEKSTPDTDFLASRTVDEKSTNGLGALPGAVDIVSTNKEEEIEVPAEENIDVIELQEEKDFSFLAGLKPNQIKAVLALANPWVYNTKKAVCDYACTTQSTLWKWQHKKKFAIAVKKMLELNIKIEDIKIRAVHIKAAQLPGARGTPEGKLYFQLIGELNQKIVVSRDPRDLSDEELDEKLDELRELTNEAKQIDT